MNFQYIIEKIMYLTSTLNCSQQFRRHWAYVEVVVLQETRTFGWTSLPDEPCSEASYEVSRSIDWSINWTRKHNGLFTLF